MENPSKTMPISAMQLEKLYIFDNQHYKFRGVTSRSNQLMKTSTKRKLTQDQINLVTKLHHKNIIGLKKIGKSKKTNEQKIYWLYYETVPFSLEMLYNKGQFDVRPEAVEAALLDIRNYLYSLKICPQFSQSNIGVNQNGVIKTYISIESILKLRLTDKSRQECDMKIKEIKIIYGSSYCRRSLKPSQIPCPMPDKRLSQQKLNKFSQVYQDCDQARKNIRSEQSKNNSMRGLVGLPTPTKEDKKYQLLCKKSESNNNFTINIFNERSSHVINKNMETIKYFQNKDKQQQEEKDRKVKAIEHQKNMQKYLYEYDDQSVDTYQMEMGEDFEMPSIRTNQKMRQTVLNSQKSWDTMTYKSPANANKNKKVKVHQSAGKKDFIHIVENNKKLLKQIQTSQNEISSDQKTQDLFMKQKTWQSSTIKSALPPNIQDRVQQALAKTKNVMQMLKNTKSFSAGK